MSNKTLLILTVIVVIGMGIILALNVMPVFFETTPSKYIPQGEVRGAAVKRNNTLYTLNFDQQVELITSLNRAIKIDRSAAAHLKKPLPLEGIILYTFEGKEIEVIPYAIENDQWIFSVPSWENKRLLKETSEGKLNQMLLHSFDA